MIARIPHKTQCDHAQTPYARRKCRAAQITASKTVEEQPMEKPRYYVTSMRARSGMLHYVYDRQTGQEVYRSRDERAATGQAEALNRSAAKPATEPATEPAETTPAPAAAPRTGWSKAARRRAGHVDGGHPLGDGVIDRGQGYTVYRDGLRGSGEVQIWDES